MDVLALFTPFTMGYIPSATVLMLRICSLEVLEDFWEVSSPHLLGLCSFYEIDAMLWLLRGSEGSIVCLWGRCRKHEQGDGLIDASTTRQSNTEGNLTRTRTNFVMSANKKMLILTLNY